MQASELLRRIQSNDAPVVVDARSPIEFQRGHIPGAVNAPVWKVLFRTAPMPADKNREMVIACMHGQRAWLVRKVWRSRAIATWPSSRGFWRNG